jgi:hypothetical protein
MGVGYYRNFTLWNNGPNPYGCTSIQSDLDIITSDNNGFGYRADDHSSDFAGATLATFSNNQFNIEGVVETNTDNDFFRFTVPTTGRFQLEAIPYNVGTGNAGSNLDLQVTLYNSAEEVVNVYNPGTLLSSVVDTTLSAGTYYAKIEGKGNAFAPEYASLGSYSLLASATPGVVLAVHRLELRGFVNGSKHELRWIIDADEEIVTQYLEISTDGRNFVPLQTVQNDLRAFIHQPEIQGPAQYRLKVKMNDGREYYTNVVHIRQAAAEKPSLVGTFVNDNSIKVSSPGIYDYSIHDMSGRMITNGKLSRGLNHISVPAITSGVYIIKYTGNLTQWTEKFLGQ